ncbi:hypothetical protein DSO52_21750 [Salmonella enterica]|nr:hypothetical protein [Salmonella enterica]
MKALVLLTVLVFICDSAYCRGGRQIEFGKTDEELIGVWVDYYIVGTVAGYKNTAGRILTTGVLDYGKVDVTKLRKHDVERLYQTAEAEWSCLSTVQNPTPHDCTTHLYNPVNAGMNQCYRSFTKATQGANLIPAESSPNLMSTSAAQAWVSKRTNELISNGSLYNYLIIHGGNRSHGGSLWYDIGTQAASASVDHTAFSLGDMVPGGVQYALICIESSEVTD